MNRIGRLGELKRRSFFRHEEADKNGEISTRHNSEQCCLC